MIVRGPLLLQVLKNGPFALGINNVNNDWFSLEEAMQPVYRLNEVVELVIYAGENRPMAVALKVAAGCTDTLFGRHTGNAAVREPIKRFGPFVEVSGPGNDLHVGYLPFDLIAFGIQI